MSENIDDILQKYGQANPNDLIDAMQDIQMKFGFISENSIKELSDHFKTAAAKIYGIATFYDEFRFNTLGKYHIKLCKGTSCHLSGSSNLKKELEKLLKIKPGQKSSNGLFSIEEVTCFGTCGLSPIMLINKEAYSSVKKEDLKNILDNLISGEI